MALSLRGYDESVTNVAARYTTAMAAALGQAGHQVTIFAEAPIPGHIHQVLPASREPGEYLSPDHEYADRLAEHLAALGPWDAIDMPAVGGEGLSVTRARRLGCNFRRTVVATRLHGPPPGAPDEQTPVSFRDDLRHAAERYVLEHADVVSTDGTAAGAVRGPTILSWPTPIDPGWLDEEQPTLDRPVRRVLFLGEISSTSGYDTFLATARLVEATVPGFRFEVHGPDTPTDPFGRSYRRWADRHTSLDGVAVTWHAAPSVARLRELLAEPAICLFAYSAARYLPDIVAACGGVPLTAAAVGSGTSTVPATSLLRHADDHALLSAVREQARQRVAQQCHPAAVARLAERGYRRARADRSERRSRTITAPRVSVVIPLYNQGRYLSETIASARASTHPELEIVVVDDGSTDSHTRDVFDALRDVIKVRQPNRGLGAARNAGIAHASADYILPLDADDLIDPSFVGVALEALRRNPELGYVNSYVRNFGLFDSKFAGFGNVLELMLFMHTDGPYTGVYQRAALAAVDGYDEDMPGFEDWDLQLRIAKAGYDSDVIPVELIRYRRHGESMVFRSSNPMRIPQLQYLFRKHQDVFAPRAESVALRLIDLWKSRLEVSQSARFTSGLTR
ncbi:glycosyltransferase [Catellatospora bangladeshensis]|uniref:Glycosyltransferase 2-like domain-containing protein n=1 Tax=Catellatospora bangladeshensis TaxID=310355 RepID=A0A8J3JRR4_9ACTN|nr:hypothetical protein Cba03nite_33630 [Catellatospora bangladeshensis]